jgi:hypothetical protein
VFAVIPALDELFDLGREVTQGNEGAAPEGLAFDDAEPDLHQVVP